jgi:PAS domain S-box-containing protein
MIAVIVGWVLNPLQSLTQAAREIGSGKLDYRINIDTKDETGSLAVAFNSMIERLQETISQLRQEVGERKKAEKELNQHRQHLEELVAERTAKLTEANVHLTQEITERKQAQEALLLGNQRFDSISNSSEYGLFLLDDQARVTFVNKFAERWFGPSKEIVGKLCCEVFKLKDPEKECAGFKTIRTGKTVKSDSLTEVLHGEKKIFYVIASPVFDRVGKVRQVVETVIDITERKKVEEELDKHRQDLEKLVDERTTELTEANEHLIQEIAERKKVEKELKEYHDHLEELVRKRTADLEETQQSLLSVLNDVNKAKEELKQANARLLELDHLKSMFIASMSHELRTPLNSIIGFTGVILQGMAGEINDEQKDQLQRVYSSAKHLLALVSDIIDISKVEAGKIKPYIEEFQLDDIIYEVALNLKKQIEDKGLTLKTNIPQSIRLKTDRRRLVQCILNYLSNAIKFTEKGRISVAASETDGMVEMSVKDSGVGIKKEDIPKLFNSFVRLDSPLKTTILGTGLGLYLTKKIATEILGGTVSVESKYGKGSTFTLKISKEISAKEKSET